MGLVFTRHHICSIPCQNICLAHLSHRGISPKRNTHSSECPQTLCSGFHTAGVIEDFYGCKGCPRKKLCFEMILCIACMPGQTIIFSIFTLGETAPSLTCIQIIIFIIEHARILKKKDLTPGGTVSF